MRKIFCGEEILHNAKIHLLSYLRQHNLNHFLLQEFNQNFICRKDLQNI